ncbi:hypothetical protein [Treponema sp. UBA3813]|uniref:hypothetical protein n=1 Tax=Treponema sp. UBA3813 TaxID=1947715 RepID=UPI0025FDA150|nr:hypothetical protein [Treponema sp. UBA3813]
MKAFILLLTCSILFFSCKPQISIKAGTSDDATIFFSTGFSESTAKTLKSVSGSDMDAPLFNKDDVLMLLKSAGAINTSATLPNQNEITTIGTLPSLQNHPLSQAGLITKNQKKLSLTLGPKQITAFYELLTEDAKAYLDLMMIPALIGETMSVKEYRELLSSMYGPSFANEIVDGKLTINLSSPNGKTKVEETLNLGELLTANEEKSWSITF